jgi:hypothetical protein
MPTYDQYRTMLPVLKHRLDDELEIQAQIMEQISSETVRFNVRMLECKLALDKVEARLTAELKDDDPKMTVAVIDGKVKRDPEREAAWKAYINALGEHGRWVGLQEAWRAKGFSIKGLGDLYAAQYFQLSSHQVRDRSLGSHPNDPAKQEDARTAIRRAGLPQGEPKPNKEEDPVRPRRRTMTDD